MKVLFFGQLRERLETDQLIVTESLTTVGQLREVLMTKGEVWQEYLAAKNCLVAVNQTISNELSPICQNDEIAFFPPVTGG